LLGCCCHKLGKNSTGASGVYPRAEHAFVLDHYFTSELFAAVHEAFSNVFPHKEVLNITIHQLVTKFWSARINLH
jgi:hypothetical protein